MRKLDWFENVSCECRYAVIHTAYLSLSAYRIAAAGIHMVFVSPTCTQIHLHEISYPTITEKVKRQKHNRNTRMLYCFTALFAAINKLHARSNAEQLEPK